MSELDEKLLRLRRCRQCGYRLPDPQSERCGECGEAIDPAERGVFVRGAACGFYATLGTAGGTGWIMALFAPLAWAFLAAVSYRINPMLAYMYGLLFGMPLYALLKRLMATPDGLVAAYLGPDGFAQVDTLPRWPLADLFVGLGFQFLIMSVLVRFMGPGVSLPLLVPLLTAWIIFVVVVNVKQWRRSHRDPIDVMLESRVKWTAKSFAKAEVAVNELVRVKCKKTNQRQVNMQFEGSNADAVDLQSCLNAWKALAMRVAEAEPPSKRFATRLEEGWAAALRAGRDVLDRARTRSQEHRAPRRGGRWD